MGLRRLAYTLCRAQVDQLPVAACLELLTQLDTGVSEHEQLQALGSSLLAAACTRVAKLLSEDAAQRGNADVQAQLLEFLGPLQHMLNDTRRRELFLDLPFELLRVSGVRCGRVRATIACEALVRLPTDAVAGVLMHYVP